MMIKGQEGMECSNASCRFHQRSLPADIRREAGFAGSIPEASFRYSKACLFHLCHCEFDFIAAVGDDVIDNVEHDGLS
jgi:hypothetical protein